MGSGRHLGTWAGEVAGKNREKRKRGKGRREKERGRKGRREKERGRKGRGRKGRREKEREKVEMDFTGGAVLKYR